ncbi:MAG: phosphonopyruvate decarboxylase [Labilithrix sp.]|nr:phosphonopyruvate decarboxylase [Labilithrix sp.]MCW5812403.1 phosphonopyruvate decarboxylase [Labilithrix sp.]
MIEAKSFVETARQAGFGLYTGVPCSYVKPFINYVIDAQAHGPTDARGRPALSYVGAANEGDAVAIATGAELGGKRAITMMQNSGLGNAVSPLTSLNAIFRIPTLLIVTLRGEPGGPKDEPQHELMGQITTKMLETMNVGWEYFPTEESEVANAIERAVGHMNKTELPFCFVMKKDSVAPHKLTSKPTMRQVPPVDPAASLADFPAVRPSRTEVLRAVQKAAGPDDLLVATTGYTGRELYACDDRDNQLYMVGSMGCAAPFGLGLARARPDKRVIVLDGDGALLMRMGCLATLGYERPANLVHVLLDNEAHDSTGTQSTVTHSVDLGGCARACGYPDVARVADAAALEAALADRKNGLRFLHVKTRPGAPEDLPRPKITPREVAARLRQHLASGAAS